jgi:glycerate kinase
VRVLIAPDSFKGSLGAAAVAAALAEGWLSVRPGDQVRRLPLADGGEGTLDVLAATVPGARWHRGRVTGPGGAPVIARWLELPAELPERGSAPAQAGTAVVELARASGLPLLARPDPLGARTTGLGELLGRALDAGVGRILVGLGGSASTDGGPGHWRRSGPGSSTLTGSPCHRVAEPWPTWPERTSANCGRRQPVGRCA